MEPDIRHPQLEILEKLRVELLTMGIIKDAVKEVAEEETIAVSHEELIWEAFNLENPVDPNKGTIKERETQAEMEAEILAPQPVVENSEDKECVKEISQDKYVNEDEICADKKINVKARIQKFFRRLFPCYPKKKAHKNKN